MSDSFLSALIAGVLALLALGVRAWWRGRAHLTAQAWKHGLLYEDGRFLRELPPGRYRQTDRRHFRIQMAIAQTQAIQPQEALTADRFQLRMSAMLTHRIPAAQLRVVLEGDAASPEERVRLAATQALRQVIVARTLDEMLGPREAIDAAFLAAVRAARCWPGSRSWRARRGM